jgi:Flp pilus assembly protein CpaB
MERIKAWLGGVRGARATAEAEGRNRLDRLRTQGRIVLPSNRAFVGALLLAVSGVATFSAWMSATDQQGEPYVVASRPLAPGAVVGADDVRTVALDLPREQAQHAFGRTDGVVGRQVLGPVSPGELVQTAQLAGVDAATSPIEVSFVLPKDRALDGRLQPGEWVDVFASDDQQTKEVVPNAQVVAIDQDDPGSFSTTSGELVVTLGLPRADQRAGLIDAVRHGEVTLTRAAGQAGRPGEQ